jgi:hypothetical protein
MLQVWLFFEGLVKGVWLPLMDGGRWYKGYMFIFPCVFKRKGEA